MPSHEDIVAYVEGQAAADRLAWIELLDSACAAAERRRRALYRKDRTGAQAAHAFTEQAKGVLYWLRFGDFPDTRHAEVRTAIAHIAKTLGPSGRNPS